MQSRVTIRTVTERTILVSHEEPLTLEHMRAQPIGLVLRFPDFDAPRVVSSEVSAVDLIEKVTS